MSTRALQTLRRAIAPRALSADAGTDRRPARPAVVVPDGVAQPLQRSTSPSYVNLIAPVPAPAQRRRVEFEVC